MAKLTVFATLSVVLIVVIPSSSFPGPGAVVSSKFYFPHFVSSDNAQTTFIVSNSGSGDAEVVFTAYDDKGDVISDGSNPASVTIFGQSQARLDFCDLFNIERHKRLTGWVKAESGNRQLSAWMMMSLDRIQGDQLDALLVSDQTANRMAFSAVFQTADTVTGISLANPNSQAAQVKATLYSEGRLADMREFQIPAFGHRTWFLHDLLRSDAPIGHVEIESSVGLVGFQQFSQEHEWTAVPMQLPEETSELVIPLSALDNFDNYWVGIALANVGDSDLNLTLSAWGRDLNLLAVPVQRLVKSHGELVSLVSDLFGSLPSVDAFIRVKADLDPARVFDGKPVISGLAIVGRTDLRALASIPLAVPPLPTLHVESSGHGFFIIPSDNRAAATSADKDKPKEKEKEKDQDNKDNDKEKGRCKDKDKGKDDAKGKDKCVNEAPAVNAGPDQTITLPDVATLSGTAADDGLPLGSTLMVSWAKVSGPGAVTFATANALSTTASFSSAGSYVLRLTATDGTLSSTSDMTIVVNPAPPPRGLPGLTDFVSHAPPTSGRYAYNTFKPGAPGFPSAGQSYVDPVFGSTITRLSDVGGANEGDYNLYVKNGFWNANGTYHTFTNTATGTADVINASTGAIVRSDTGFTFDSSFDPVDPDILWKWSGADLRKYIISTGVETTEKTFPAPLQTLGGTTDWISADGRYFLLAWNGALHVWRRSGDVTYSGSIIHTIGNGWAGMTPDGKYVAVVDDPNGTNYRYSYAINHSAQTLSSSGVMFWNSSLNDDHADLLSASDGKNYAISANSYDGYIYAVDIAQNMSGKTPDEQAAANRLLIKTDWNVLGDYHFSCVARGPFRDWCVVSTISTDDAFDSSPAWYPFKSEIFAVNVLTGAVNRYAHHRSRSVTLATYDRYPRANVDWDGTGIIFSSDYDFPGSNTNYSDLYRIR